MAMSPAINAGAHERALEIENFRVDAVFLKQARLARCPDGGVIHAQRAVSDSDLIRAARAGGADQREHHEEESCNVSMRRERKRSAHRHTPHTLDCSPFTVNTGDEKVSVQKRAGANHAEQCPPFTRASTVDI